MLTARLQAVRARLLGWCLVAAPLLALAGPAAATERFITILNRTDFIIQNVQAFRSSDPLRVKQIFDTANIYEGEQGRYAIEDVDDECFYDFDLTLADGTHYGFGGVNICQQHVMPVTDATLDDQFQRQYDGR